MYIVIYDASRASSAAHETIFGRHHLGHRHLDQRQRAHPRAADTTWAWRFGTASAGRPAFPSSNKAPPPDVLGSDQQMLIQSELEGDMRKLAGGSNCGQVRFEVGGEPLRVGFCHCQVCRKETGSLGNFLPSGRPTKSRWLGRLEVGGARPTTVIFAPRAVLPCLGS